MRRCRHSSGRAFAIRLVVVFLMTLMIHQAVAVPSQFILLLSATQTTNPASTDIRWVKYSNDGASLWFLTNFRAAPSGTDLHIYMDVTWLTQGGYIGSTGGDPAHRATDYVIVTGASTTAGTLFFWTGSQWSQVPGSTVTIVSFNTTAFYVSTPLSGINYGKATAGDSMKVYAASAVNAQPPSFDDSKFKDTLPQQGLSQPIQSQNIPEFPGPTLFVFVGFAVVFILTVYRKFPFSRRNT